ncbi:MAG: hypothetical protein RQ833_12245 [Sphingomonadaceae bacterium]|nr:hypothetical protein [Sphingomonadaceae bacterium]
MSPGTIASLIVAVALAGGGGWLWGQWRGAVAEAVRAEGRATNADREAAALRVANQGLAAQLAEARGQMLAIGETRAARAAVLSEDQRRATATSARLSELVGRLRTPPAPTSCDADAAAIAADAARIVAALPARAAVPSSSSALRFAAPPASPLPTGMTVTAPAPGFADAFSEEVQAR